MKSPDLSPPRKVKRPLDSSPPAKPERMTTTLEGKKAGLQDATSMREENETRRKRHEDVLRKMMEEDKLESEQNCTRLYCIVY